MQNLEDIPGAADLYGKLFVCHAAKWNQDTAPGNCVTCSDMAGNGNRR
jgi:hypothetical protein